MAEKTIFELRCGNPLRSAFRCARLDGRSFARSRAHLHLALADVLAVQSLVQPLVIVVVEGDLPAQVQDLVVPLNNSSQQLSQLAFLTPVSGDNRAGGITVVAAHSAHFLVGVSQLSFVFPLLGG